MKSLIFYYSQFENTHIIARAIHQGITQKINRCDIFRLKGSYLRYREIQPQDFVNYDLIGRQSGMERYPLN